MKRVTRVGILHMIGKGPARYHEIAGDTVQYPDRDKRKRVYAMVQRLMEAGEIKRVRINGLDYYTTPDWQMSDEHFLRLLEEESVKTVDGCMLWSGFTCPNRGPMGLGRVNLRRTVWEMKRGKISTEVTIKPSCGQWSCVAYGCMEAVTKSQRTKGVPKMPLHAMNIAKASRERNGKLGWDKVRAIRESRDTHVALAARFQVSKNTIIAVRKNRSWQEETPAGMFSALIQQEKRAA